jgi:Tfp pilus assembly protein PilF
MKVVALFLFFLFFQFISINPAHAQALEICTRSAGEPSLGESWGAIPYVFGKVKVSGADDNAKLPKVVVANTERGRPEKRIIVDRTGNYCFRRTSGEIDALVVVYVENVELGRREISGLGPPQQREDFELNAGGSVQSARPGTINAKYTYPENGKTTDLYRKALDAKKSKDREKLLDLLKQIVAIDPNDFQAWAKLGAIYSKLKGYDDAEEAFQKAIELRTDYAPAMVGLGRVYLAQIKTDKAIAIAQRAVAADPASARAFQVLGNAYLQAKKGSLGVEALNKALALDPMGVADSHLMLAVLYDRAGAKDLASHEYSLFLEKFPNHPDHKKFEKYIKDNPEH